MKWRHYLSFASVVFLSLFFGSFIITNDSFAVSPISVTIPSGTANPTTNLFPDCDSSCFSQYNYLKIDNSYSSTSTVSNNFEIRFLSGASGPYLTLSPYFSTNIFAFPSFNSHVTALRFRTSVTRDYDVTYTLLDSLPNPSGSFSISENGTYNVTNYAEVSVDVPADVIQGDYHDDLVNIQNAIITCGAILLVLYFFYCIYRLIIKNSGVH